MNDALLPLWKEIPLPSEEERRLFEEWANQREEEQRQRDEREKNRVIVIDL